ncbi:SOS-response transcriptional repressor LexA [Rhizobium sp. BK196]|uniref:LexA family transcriptional regulator n=1 Tax=Rhizobium sp. BK196 TaxID=2587073 RepID=UPI001616E57C|nr:LexA family transcriptional regulator [Rhizobium sp. BK196]MBB3313669.1 SOS-response transcriptional repressor LexA [Rhizobium sp. BK196]
MDKSFGQIVRAERERRGLSQVELAQLTNTTQQSIDRIERDVVARSRSAPEVAAFLEIPFPFSGQSTMPDAVIRRTLPDGTIDTQIVQIKNPSPIPRENLIGLPDLPIYSAVRGGSWSDSVVVSSDPIDYVKRPEPLARAKNGYGLYVLGDSMVPAFRNGDLALVHPNLPYSAGDEVIISTHDHHGEHYAILKQLVRATADTWHLRQYNPPDGEPAEFSLPREKWPTCHLVVGAYRKR